jgi:hypothetical protein
MDDLRSGGCRGGKWGTAAFPDGIGYDQQLGKLKGESMAEDRLQAMTRRDLRRG